jgi:hypothetical protein
MNLQHAIWYLVGVCGVVLLGIVIAKARMSLPKRQQPSRRKRSSSLNFACKFVLAGLDLLLVAAVLYSGSAAAFFYSAASSDGEEAPSPTSVRSTPSSQLLAVVCDVSCVVLGCLLCCLVLPFVLS